MATQIRSLSSFALSVSGAAKLKKNSTGTCWKHARETEGGMGRRKAGALRAPAFLFSRPELIGDYETDPVELHAIWRREARNPALHRVLDLISGASD